MFALVLPQVVPSRFWKRGCSSASSSIHQQVVAQILRNPAQTLRKHCATLRKPSANPAQTLRKPCANTTQNMRKPCANPAQHCANPAQTLGWLSKQIGWLSKQNAAGTGCRFEHASRVDRTTNTNRLIPFSCSDCGSILGRLRLIPFSCSD